MIQNATTHANGGVQKLGYHAGLGLGFGVRGLGFRGFGGPW